MSSIHCLLGLPWWRKPSTLPSKTVSAKFPALPLVTCPKYCSFIRANFPINSLSRPISSNIDILVRCSFQEIQSIKTRFYFYPISLMSIPPHHTETLPRPSTSSLWFSMQTWRFCPSLLYSLHYLCILTFTYYSRRWSDIILEVAAVSIDWSVTCLSRVLTMASWQCETRTHPNYILFCYQSAPATDHASHPGCISSC